MDVWFIYKDFEKVVKEVWRSGEEGVLLSEKLKIVKKEMKSGTRRVLG